MKPGKKREKVGVKEIAEALNISASTVSRALNDHPRINKETKIRVRQTAARLGYSQRLPETGEVQKGNVVAVVVPSLADDFYRTVGEGITAFFKEKGFVTFYIGTNGDNEYRENFYHNFRKYGISGIVEIVSDKNMGTANFEIINKEALPFVTVCEPDEDTPFNAVLPDMYRGVQKIVTYLLSVKTNSLALFLEDKKRPEDFYLENSLETAIDSPEGEQIKLKVYSGLKGIDFTKEVESLLNKKNHPQVLLVKNRESALEVMYLAARLGINIPDDMLLIAVGTGAETGGGAASNLSVLKIPAFDMGYEAGKLLFYQIENYDTEKKRTVLPSEFILKNSAIRINP